jgi:hypothetical protein
MNFDDWVDVEGLSPAERARLERVHDLLLQAGPPAALPSELERPPAPVIPLRRVNRRSGMVALLAAAILVAGAFAGGYFTAHNGSMHVVREASLQSSSGRAFASLRIGNRYESGNWPIAMTVRGLPQQTKEGAYYLLLLWHNGKPAGVCGAFRVERGVTKLHFDVPYDITASTQWVITAIQPGERYPGTVLMKTV